MVTILNNLLKTISFLRYRFQYLINYIVIGILAVSFEIIIAKYLIPFNIPFLMKATIGFLLSVLLAFYLNAKLNFKVPKSKNKRTFIAFMIIATIAFLLNLILIRLVLYQFRIDYSLVRFPTAAIVFILSYTAHRRITFDFVKNIGIAIHLNKNENISNIYSKIRYYSDFIHIDLTDKTFSKQAPEIDLSIIKDINKTWGLKKMLHIMSETPSLWIKKLHQSTDVIIFHTEIKEPVKDVLRLCKHYKKKTGLALNTNSDISSIEEYLPYINFVQVMGIDELGKSGQSFNPDSLKKVNQLNELKKQHRFEIIFDGGVKPTNIGKINAKYIVSASGLLSSENPIKSFMELKTSLRYHSIANQLREDILNGIKEITETTPFILSGNIVGSFSEDKDLQGINDIDIVIIADKLTKTKFNIILEEFNKLKDKIQSKYGYQTIINPTLGPLKFNYDNIVFHLMLYDKESHKTHCEKSPFTCYDWQRSKIFFKKPMSEIHKVTHLQPNHFFNSRRSATEYLSEIKSNQISYREYKFKNNKTIEEKKLKEMDNRDKIEFSYHIIRFLVYNFLKLYYKQNKVPNPKDTLKIYFKIFPKNREKHINLLNQIHKMRKSRDFREYPGLIKSVESFITDFEEQFQRQYDGKVVYFIRHAQTKENKPHKELGIKFFGRGQDVDIINPGKKEIEEVRKKIRGIELVFSSPSKRCKQTLQLITNKEITEHPHLHEIDYGNLEGLYLKQAQEKYPELFEAWKKGEDPRFPYGENTQDVLTRYNEFINHLSQQPQQTHLICTHNVFLRTLIGTTLNLPMQDWFKISIPHFEPFRLLLTKDNKTYIELTDSQTKEIFKNF